MLTCFNSIGKRDGLVHILDAVPVHKILCEYVKRTLAMLEYGLSTRSLFIYLFIQKCLVGFLVSGRHNNAVA